MQSKNVRVGLSSLGNVENATRLNKSCASETHSGLRIELEWYSRIINSRRHRFLSNKRQALGRALDGWRIINVSVVCVVISRHYKSKLFEWGRWTFFIIQSPKRLLNRLLPSAMSLSTKKKCFSWETKISQHIKKIHVRNGLLTERDVENIWNALAWHVISEQDEQGPH